MSRWQVYKREEASGVDYRVGRPYLSRILRRPKIKWLDLTIFDLDHARRLCHKENWEPQPWRVVKDDV